MCIFTYNVVWERFVVTFRSILTNSTLKKIVDGWYPRAVLSTPVVLARDAGIVNEFVTEMRKWGASVSETRAAVTLALGKASVDCFAQSLNQAFLAASGMFLLCLIVFA